MKIEGFMSCNTLMPGCAQIVDPWPTASGACYFGNTPTLRPGRCRKNEFAERLDTFMCNPNFNTLDYCAYGKFMRSKKLVLNYFEHIATCFPNISLRFHWTTCTCLCNFLHVCVSNSPWLGFQHAKVRFHFRCRFCSCIAGTCWCQVSFLGIIYWTFDGMIDWCFNHLKHGHYMFQSPKTRLLHVSIAQKMVARLGSVKSKLKAKIVMSIDNHYVVI